MIRDMQRDHRVWIEDNFPGERPSWHPLLGIDEEVGELNHHFLKRVQGIRTNENHRAGILDALGDIFIFMLDFANCEDIDLQDAILTARAVVYKRDWQKNRATGRHITVKVEQDVAEGDLVPGIGMTGVPTGVKAEDKLGLDWNCKVVAEEEETNAERQM